MTVAELIEKLKKLPPNADVMFVDSIGPHFCDSPYIYTITDDDASNCGDCEDMVGDDVVAMRAG